MGKRGFIVLLLTVCLSACSIRPPEQVILSTVGSGKSVTVYSTRHYEVDNQLYEAFTKQTGIAVNEIKGTSEELVARLQNEGENTLADVFISVDGGILDSAKRAGLLQPIESADVLSNVSPEWQDPEGYWVGIASRARVIVYSKNRVDQRQLSTYEDLTDERWKGRLLVRSSSNQYNQALLASFIEINGKSQAEKWASGIVQNLARSPEGGDRDQAKAISTGIGDIAIMNTYYVGQLVNSEDEEEAGLARNLGVFFPNQYTTGTHVNVSGIGLVEHSRNKDNAIRLIAFMTGKEGQTMLAQGGYEFPVNEEAEVPDLLKSWTGFKKQKISFEVLGTRNEEAIDIFNRAGWK